jgi:hypothetical protein
MSRNVDPPTTDPDVPTWPLNSCWECNCQKDKHDGPCTQCGCDGYEEAPRPRVRELDDSDPHFEPGALSLKED